MANESIRFIDTIRNALSIKDGTKRRLEDLMVSQPSTEIVEMMNKIKNRSKGEQLRLLNHLVKKGKEIHLKVFTEKTLNKAAQSIVSLVDQRQPEWGNDKSIVAWAHPLINELNLESLLSPIRVPIYFPGMGAKHLEKDHSPEYRQEIREKVINAYIGITSADFCVADTATLVMKAEEGHPRSFSLVPSIHIVVINLNQIVKNLDEFYALLKWDALQKEKGLTRCMTFISGPSKTADIEATLVHGAHGPKEMYLYVIT